VSPLMATETPNQSWLFRFPGVNSASCAHALVVAMCGFDAAKDTQEARQTMIVTQELRCRIRIPPEEPSLQKLSREI
jgi:hypothetical protein